MYSPHNNANKEIDNQQKSVTVNEKKDIVIEESYPMSFLLLEGEEECFVKGYN